MLIMRYKKFCRFEFISHLDTLRHITKTLNRAKIEVAYSQGFNPHMLVYLSSPIYVGLKSSSEYALIETNIDPETFKQRFNDYSPKGIKCISAFSVSKKHKIAGLIDSALYSFTFEKEYDILNKILEKDSIIFKDRRDKEIDIRPLIYDIKVEKTVLYGRLAFGNTMLRADTMCEYLYSLTGEKPKEEKLEAYIQGKLPEDILT